MASSFFESTQNREVGNKNRNIHISSSERLFAMTVYDTMQSITYKLQDTMLRKAPITEWELDIARSSTLPWVLLQPEERSALAEMLFATHGTTLPFLEYFSRDKDPFIRKKVAIHQHTPVALLKQLASDAEWIVRATVATNNKTPTNVLSKLAHDENAEVREYAACHKNISHVDIELLADDPDCSVREAIIKRRDCPEHLIEKMKKDKSDKIRSIASKNSL